MPIYCVSLINDRIYIKTVGSEQTMTVGKNQVFYDVSVRKAFRVYVSAKSAVNARKKGEVLLQDFIATAWPKAKTLLDNIKQGVPVYLRFPPKYFSEKATLHKITKDPATSSFYRVWRDMDGIRSHNLTQDEDQILSFLAAHNIYVIPNTGACA